MSEVSNTIARLLWRLCPGAFLTWALGGLMHWALSILESEEERECMLRSKAYCAWYGGWLMLIEHRLNALITLRAMQNLKRRYYADKDILCVRAWGVASLADAYARFTNLARRYGDIDRLVRIRTRKLKRLFERCDFQLDVHPVHAQPTPAAGAGARVEGVGGVGVKSAGVAVALPATVRIRAPPAHPSKNQRGTQLAGPVCENEISCPKDLNPSLHQSTKTCLAFTHANKRSDDGNLYPACAQ